MLALLRQIEISRLDPRQAVELCIGFSNGKQRKNSFPKSAQQEDNEFAS
jgi:hypothetical protein